MKKLIISVCIVFAAVEGTVYADMAPPPGVNLARQRLGPIPTGVTGVALTVAVVLGGLFARGKGRTGIGIGSLMLASVILAVTAVAVYIATLPVPVRERRFDRGPRDPIPSPPRADELQAVASLLAAAPEAGFPHCLPWAAIAAVRPRWDARTQGWALLDRLELDAGQISNGGDEMIRLVCHGSEAIFFLT